MHELILGGGRSGKSRCAEARAAAWLQTPGHSAVLIATALPGDDEMRQRIARHRADRALRVPALQTQEEALALPAALLEASSPQRMVVVDCLTLWLTQQLMPLRGPGLDDEAWQTQQVLLCSALGHVAGPVVMVSNELGMGVTPLGREVRRYLDALGALHQAVAGCCARVTLMVAGIEVRVKG